MVHYQVLFRGDYEVERRLLQTSEKRLRLHNRHSVCLILRASHFIPTC